MKGFIIMEEHLSGVDSCVYGVFTDLSMAMAHFHGLIEQNEDFNENSIVMEEDGIAHSYSLEEEANGDYSEYTTYRVCVLPIYE